MNFSGISGHTLLGKALRFPLSFIPGNLKVPILQGRLKGKKWIVGSGVHGYWLGSYEYEKRRLFEEVVKPGSIVFDVGAHVGFYTLLASVLVGIQGKVFAFEPLPRNLHFLRTHIEINCIMNVTIIEAAVSNFSGATMFEEGPDSSTGRILPTGRLSVRTVSLDDLYRGGEIPLPDLIKIDVEGAEMLVLSGAELILERSRPTLFLATHGRDVHQECCKYLERLGYVLEPITGKSIDITDEVLARKLG